MNNYTVVIKTRQADVTPAQVQTAVEDLLMRALQFAGRSGDDRNG